VYELIGEQYGDPYFPNLGDTSRALENVQKAIVLAEQLYRTYPEPYDTRELYYSNIQMAGILWARGHTQQALEYQNRGEALLNSMPLTHPRLQTDQVPVYVPESQLIRQERGMAMVRRANLLAEAGRLKDAQAALHDSRRILESLFWADPMNYGLRRDVTRNYNLSADLLARTGDLRGALKMYRQALPLMKEAPAVQRNLTDARQHLADTYEGTGNTLAAMGRTAESLENCSNALAIRETLAQLDPNDARYKFSLAKNYLSLASILAKAQDRLGAIDNYRRAIAIQKSLAAHDPFNALVARDLANTQRDLRALNATALRHPTGRDNRRSGLHVSGAGAGPGR
jgi:tetratricopeptide (TPR) repeat protein